MNQFDLKICRIIKDELSKVMTIIEVRAFGSRAREDGDQYSDLDLFIKVEVINKEIKETIKTKTWEIGLSYGVVVSPLIFSRNEVEVSPLKSSSILKVISSEGITI